MAKRKDKKTTANKGKNSKTSKKKKEKKIPFHRQPGDLSLEKWQTGLRKQYGKESHFIMENLGDHRVFSDFSVRNPENGNTYRVAIRSMGDEQNYCSCLDFKTNRLGVCKHIAFVQYTIENTWGNKSAIKRGYHQPHSSIYLDYRDGRKIKLSIGAEQKEAFQLFAKKYFDEELTINPEGFSFFEKILEEGRSIAENFRCYEDALEFVLGRRELLQRNARIDQLFPDGPDSSTFDQLLKVKLYSYQREGVLFAARAGRCLIADEMGLGKTIQAIAAAQLFKKEFGISKVLIVCPTSLKYQWKSEIERFSDSTAYVVEGGKLKRHKQYAEKDEFFTIAGYHTVANDVKELNKQEFDLLILDEAQRIKNWQTKTSAAIKKLQTNYAFVLTGTPLENKLEELYSIIQVIDQFRLPPLYLFLRRYQVTNENGKVVGFKNLHEIGKNLSDVLLRRTKKQVLKQLPQRQDKTLIVPMTRDQMDWHNDLSETVGRLVSKWRRQQFLHEKDRRRLMLSLSQMRMVCDSTYILDQTDRHDTKVDELMCILEEFFTNQYGEKVVVFSQWQRMAHLVEQELIERGIGYQFLHGGVPSKKRGDLLKTFKEDSDCLVFLSTDAGGVGLNLQNASLVVSLDVPWNPAVLEQRIARVWRMGQENAVQVINLVSAGTIEHRMLDVLKFKDSMAKGVLDDGEDFIFMESSRFNKFMGKMEDLTGGTWVSDTEEIGKTIQEEAADIGPAAPAIEEPSLLPEPAEKEAPTPIPGQEEVPVPATESSGGNGKPAGRDSRGGTPPSPEELVQTGVSFLSNLAKTLSDPVKTQKLVSSLTDKDEKTGQTYLKIPVEDEASVSQALNVLGGLFKAFSGNA